MSIITKKNGLIVYELSEEEREKITNGNESDVLLDVYKDLFLNNVILYIIKHEISLFDQDYFCRQNFINEFFKIEDIKVLSSIYFVEGTRIGFDSKRGGNIYCIDFLFTHFRDLISNFLKRYSLGKFGFIDFRFDCNLKDLIAAYYMEQKRLGQNLLQNDEAAPNYFQIASVALDGTQSIYFYKLWSTFESQILDGIIKNLIDNVPISADVNENEVEINYDFWIKEESDESLTDNQTTIYVKDIISMYFKKLVYDFLDFYGIANYNDCVGGVTRIKCSLKDLKKVYYSEKQRLRYFDINDGSIRKLVKEDKQS